MDAVTYKKELISALNHINEFNLDMIIKEILYTRQKNKKIFIAGNGGSSTTSSHISTDLTFNSNIRNPTLRVFSLSNNVATLTAIGNDINFENIFSRQIEMLGEENDLVILISASGNSLNLINCIDICIEKKIKTIGLTGFDGGKISKLVDLSIHVPTKLGLYGVVEDAHMIIGHLLTEKLKSIAMKELSFE
jgi:phosphoheptose isomerase